MHINAKGIGRINDAHVERFKSKIGDPVATIDWKRKVVHYDCWPWLAGQDGRGYGDFGVKCRTIKAHQMSYELWVGPIPKGGWILHVCDRRDCVNPDHLFLGTPTDNASDRDAKGRSDNIRIGERNGMAGITKETALEIIRLRKQGLGCAAILDRIDDPNATRSIVNKIIYNETWLHLPRD